MQGTLREILQAPQHVKTVKIISVTHIWFCDYKLEVGCVHYLHCLCMMGNPMESLLRALISKSKTLCPSKVA